MLCIISPAKRLDYERPFTLSEHTLPTRLDQSLVLIKKLRTLSAKKIGAMMSLSPALATLNHQRYQQWEPTFAPGAAKQAILVFRGDVYLGLEAEGFSNKEFSYAQDHLRILSGLHGLLKPLDLMLPYRLEMGAGLQVGKTKNLYEFWGDALTSEINETLKGHKNKVLVNLASGEYFSAIKQANLKAELVHCEFKEERGNSFKMIGTYAKKARGMMVRYVVKNKVDDVEGLKGFNIDGYAFNAKLSGANALVFTRPQVPLKR